MVFAASADGAPGQAEDLARGLTHPVAEVLDVVQALRFEVCGVGIGGAVNSGSAVDGADIGVEGHQLSPRVVAGREQLERKHGEYAAAWEPPPYIAAAAYLSFVAGFARRPAGRPLRSATVSVAIGAGGRPPRFCHGWQPPR